MKLAALALVAALAIAGCRAAEDPQEALDGVHDLTPDTFDKFVNGGKHALVEFYAPWCGHCKHLTPEYKKLGAAIQGDGKLKSRVVIAKVNADEHRSLGERFGVQGFPTIKFFSRGKPVDAPEDYRGARKAEDFLAFIGEQLAADKGFARVDSLDGIAQRFREAGADLVGLVSELTAAAGKLTDTDAKSAGELYVKYAGKAADKGVAYFQKESDRLERMLESGNVGGGKAGEIARKLSVLGAFTEEAEVAEE